MDYQGQNIKDIALFKPKKELASTAQAEKILTALYIVSEHLEDRGLKTRIRENGLELFSMLRFFNREPDIFLAQEITSAIEEIASFLRLAMTMGIVSRTNGEIIATALENLAKALEKAVHYEPPAFNLKELFEETPATPGVPGTPGVKPKSNGQEEILKDKVSRIPDVKSNGQTGEKSTKQEKSKGRNAPEKTASALLDLNEEEREKEEEIKFVKIPENEGKIRAERQEKILEAVRNLGDVTVADIREFLPELGEKMLQRELNVLVQSGLIVREGIKRWARYMPA